MNKIQFKSRKEASAFLSTKGIDTSNWTEEKWLNINKGQSEIHMMALAECMWDAMNESSPNKLSHGEWHIPFVENVDELGIDAAIKVSVARCARVSYTTIGDDKQSSFESDIALHNKLLESGHMSPFEHIGCAMRSPYNSFGDCFGRGPIDEVDHYYASGRSRNFKGFVQYRNLIELKHK